MGDLAVWHLLLDSFFHAMPVAHHPSAGWASVDCYFGWHFVSEKVNSIRFTRRFNSEFELKSMSTSDISSYTVFRRSKSDLYV